MTDERDRHIREQLSEAAKAIEKALHAILDAGHTSIFQRRQGELQFYIDGINRLRETHYTKETL